MVDLKTENMFGFWKDSQDYELRLETDVLDFGQRGMKTLTAVEVGADYSKSNFPLETRVKFKYNYMENSFSKSAWKMLNREGVVYPLVTAAEMKICLRGPDYRDAKASISYMTMRLRMSDKRSLRGRFNVNKAVSGSD